MSAWKRGRVAAITHGSDDDDVKDDDDDYDDDDCDDETDDDADDDVDGEVEGDEDDDTGVCQAEVNIVRYLDGEIDENGT